MCNLLFRTMLLPGKKNCVNVMPMFKKNSRGTKPLVTQSVSLAFRDGKLVRTLITDKNLWMHGLDKFVEESCTLQIQSPEHSHTVILFVLNSSSTVVGICTGYHSLTFCTCFWLKLVPSGVSHGSVLIPQLFKPVLHVLPPTTAFSAPLLPAEHTKRAVSGAAWFSLPFCRLHGASSRGCWPHWLHPSCMCLASIS